MKKIIFVLSLVAVPAFAAPPNQGNPTYGSVTLQTPLAASSGGCGSTTFSGCLANLGGLSTGAAASTYAPLLNAPLGGVPTAPTASPLTNNSQISTTGYTDSAVGVEKTRAQTAESTNAAAINSETSRAEAAEALKASLASPAFTGAPSLPTGTVGVTQAPGTSTTTLATTAFDTAAVGVETSRATAAEALKAPLASPGLTGSPTAPTASPLTSNGQLATTGYADSAVAVERARAQGSESTLATSAAAAQSTANAALPLAGGTMTGQLHNSSSSTPGIFANSIEGGNLVESSSFQTVNNVNASGSTFPLQYWKETASWNGYYTGGETSPNENNVTDLMNSSGMMDGYAMNISLGTGQSGGVNGIKGSVNVTNTPVTAGPYVGVWGVAQAAALSGSANIWNAGSINNSEGGVWGEWIQANVLANASNYYGSYGEEVDTNVSPSTAVPPAVVIGVDSVDQNTGEGTFVNAGMAINGSNSFTDGLDVGIPVGDWPLDGTGAIIKASRRNYSRSSSTVDPAAMYGIDFRVVKFGTGGAAIATPDFSVDPTGNVTANHITTLGIVQAQTATLTGVTIKSGGIYTGSIPTFVVQTPPSGTTATAAVSTMVGVAVGKFGSSGENYAVGNIVSFSGGTGTAPTFTVSSVDANGGITGLTLATNGSTTNPPTPGQAIVLTGGSGTGAEVFIQWSSSAGTYVPSAETFAATGGGYAVGNTISPVGDTGTEPGFTVASVTAQGGILTTTLATPGLATALAGTGYQSTTTGGSGSDATIQPEWSIGSMTVTPGSGYTPAPPPMILESMATSDSETVRASLVAQMTALNAPLSLNPSGGLIEAGAPVQLTTYTVATLPTCSASDANSLLAVTDATAPTYNGSLTGGGTVHIPVFCNGTAWTAH